MHKFISTLGILFLVISGVLNLSDDGSVKSSVPEAQSETVSVVIHSEDLIEMVVSDLEGDGSDEQIKMFRLNNDLCIYVNQSGFMMRKVYSGDYTAFDISPKLKLWETRSGEKLLYVYCSYEVNGGTDGLYRAKLLSYKDGSIEEIWNTELDHEMISYGVEDEAFFIKFDDRNKAAQFFYNLDDARYDKANRILDDSENVFDLLKKEGSVKIYESEFLNTMDYNLDGKPEIITKNPIFFHEQNAYITSLFTVWSFADYEMKLEKVFALDRYSSESMVMTEIIAHGYISENQLREVVESRIEGNHLSSDDIRAIIENLIKKEIIIKREDKYYLDI